MTSPTDSNASSMTKPGNRLDHIIHGADFWANRLAFLGKTLGIVFVGSGLVWLAGVLLVSPLFLDSVERHQFLGLLGAKLATLFFMGGYFDVIIPVLKDGQLIELTRKAGAVADAMPRTWNGLLSKVWIAALLAMMPAILAGKWLWRIFVKTGEDLKKHDHLRGSRMVEPDELNQIIKETQDAFDAKLRANGKEPDPPVMQIDVGLVTLPKDREVQGFYISGSTGSGKTVAQKSIMRQVRDANQKMIVYDPAPEFIKEFWRPGDIILNPLDARGAYWEPWAEIRKSYDYKAFAESLIELDPKYASFAQAAQTVLAAMLEKTSSIEELVNASRYGLEDMEKFLKGTPAQGVITAANARGSDTVLGMIRQKLSVFNYMLPPNYALKPGEQAFSIRDWVSNDDDRRWIFLVAPEDQRPLLRPLVTLWFDIVAREIMVLKSNNDLPVEKRRRIWLMLEELPSLPAIPSLEGLTAKGRKYGAVWVITVQDPGQLNDIYGPERTKAILQNCNTWLVFRANNAETAKMVSAQIGQFEEMEKMTTLSFGVEEDKDGASYTSKRALRDAAMPSEIQRLPDLHCFLVLYGPFPSTKLHIPYVSFREVAEGSVMRADLVVGHGVAKADALVLESKEDTPLTSRDGVHIKEQRDGVHLTQAVTKADLRGIFN
ncbi:MAG: type IV secretion system DNA-binding domain-containing protein [Bacillota bacterium]